MSALSLFLPGATVSGHMDALSSQTPNKQRSLPFHRGRCCVCGGPELLMTPHRDTCEANKASAHKEHPARLKSTVSNGATVLGPPQFHGLRVQVHRDGALPAFESRTPKSSHLSQGPAAQSPRKERVCGSILRVSRSFSILTRPSQGKWCIQERKQS